MHVLYVNVVKTSFSEEAPKGYCFETCFIVIHILHVHPLILFLNMQKTILYGSFKIVS